MDEFKLKNFSKFVENFKVKRQQDFKPSVEDKVNEVVERLNLPEIKEKLDSAKLKGKEQGIFKELSDEEVEKALEKDSAKAKIIENLKKVNFKGVGLNDKVDNASAEPVKKDLAAESAQEADICEAGAKKTHNFNSVSFTAGLAYLASLSTKATPKVPTIEPPVNWSPSPEPTEPEIPEGAIVLARAGSSEVSDATPSTKTITVTSTPQVVVLKNPYTGSNFSYTVKLKENITSNKSVTFDFLKNGRLVITGDYIDITAGDNQDDDLIIMGKYNVIKTGDKDDIVRIGSGGKVASKSYHTSSSWQRGNTVKTGSGNDYIYMYSYYSDYNVDMGEGDFDNIYLLYSYYKAANIKNASNVAQYIKETVDGEDVYRTKIIAGDGKSIDGYDGWGFQEQAPYCMFLSLVNSLSHCTGKTKISDFMTYTYNSSTQEYTVTFPKYNGPKSNTITVSKDDVVACKDVQTGKTDNNAFSGDFDSKLLVYSLNKLMKKNSQGNIYSIDRAYQYLCGGDGTSGCGYTSYEIEKGENDKEIVVQTEEMMNEWKRKFLAFYELYNRNDDSGINNMSLVFTKKQKQDNEYGIPYSHACGIKEVGKNARGEYYVVVINPWDDSDCIKFSLDDLAKCKVGINIYGYKGEELNAKLATVASYNS